MEEEAKVNEIDSDLFDLIKRKCYQITTSDDDDTAKRLKDTILDAIPKLTRIIGVPKDEKIDFKIPGEERDLLKNYCFYAWNDKEAQFKDNYLDDIMVIRSKYEVKSFVGEDE